MKFIEEEKEFENEIENELNELGWESSTDFRTHNFSDVFNFELLTKKIQEINNCSQILAEKVIFEIRKLNDDIYTMNKNAYEIIHDGIKVYDDESKRTLSLHVVSRNYKNNTYQLIRQFELTNESFSKSRIPDCVLFINGLPFVTMEFKSAWAKETLKDAYNQDKSIHRFSPKLYAFNVMVFISNYLQSKYGTISSPFNRFIGWNNWENKDKNGTTYNPIQWLFDREKLIDFIFNFTFWSNEKPPIKYLAPPHQYRAAQSTINKLNFTQDNRGGIVWHTQGSGKSVTMIYLVNKIRKQWPKSTILLITDRVSLDQQLYQRFINAKYFLRTKAEIIESRKDLVLRLKNKEHFGLIFTTVQKFAEETGLLSDRSDIFILVDEAHRSQNNIEGERKISHTNQEYITKFGYASFMRKAFPNAKITGFTGTPLMKADYESTEVFGDYNDIYSMNDSVKDGTTVPIFYETTHLKLDIDQKSLFEIDKIQKQYAKSLNPNDISSEQKMDELLKSVNHSTIFENEKIIKAKCEQILEHYSKQKHVLHGKAMIVASSRKAAHIYYKTLISLDESLKNKTILVITRTNKDSEELSKAIIPDNQKDSIATEFRSSHSKYKIAIVVDMWLTGFDVPDLDVMYIDKIIKWHNLMQAIARVNRTYESDPNNEGQTNKKYSGLIVDFSNIWKHISDALLQYASGTDSKKNITIQDVELGKNKLLECFRIMNDYYVKGLLTFDGLNPHDKYKFIINAFNNLLKLNSDEKTKFILLARKTKRYLKISYSVVTDKIGMIANCIEAINNLLSRSSIINDEKLSFTIDKINEMVHQAIDADSSKITIRKGKISKDINAVAEIIGDEAETLIKNSPFVATELLKHSIESEINKLRRTRPVFAKKISDKLLNILKESEKIADIENTMKLLRDLSKEIVEGKDIGIHFKDPQLQAFFDVVSNDDYLKHNNNSEVLMQIAKDLNEEVEKNITSQFYTNPAVQAKVAYALTRLLKRKYNYPPEKIRGIAGESGILVDSIKREIKINPSYFTRGEKSHNN